MPSRTASSNATAPLGSETGAGHQDLPSVHELGAAAQAVAPIFSRGTAASRQGNDAREQVPQEDQAMSEFPRTILARINLGAADAIARETALRGFRPPLRTAKPQWTEEYFPPVPARWPAVRAPRAGSGR
jgi:hypothetical protein